MNLLRQGFRKLSYCRHTDLTCIQTDAGENMTTPLRGW